MNERGGFNVIILILVLFSVVSLYLSSSGLSTLMNKEVTQQYKIKENLSITFDNIMKTINNPFLLEKSLKKSQNSAVKCFEDFSCPPNSTWSPLVFYDINEQVISHGETVGLDAFGQKCSLATEFHNCVAIVKVQWKVNCATNVLPCMNPSLAIQLSLAPAPNTHLVLDYSKFYSEFVFEEAHIVFSL